MIDKNKIELSCVCGCSVINVTTFENGTFIEITNNEDLSTNHLVISPEDSAELYNFLKSYWEGY